MDTNVINIVKQLNNPPKKRASPFQRVLRTIDGISIEGALSILHVFNYRGETLYSPDGGVKLKAEDLTDAERYPELEGRTAEETPIYWFWGGPPNKLTWWEGTLYTLLLDRIFCECHDNGPEAVARWIGTDDEC
jgi:hypothetical protein